MSWISQTCVYYIQNIAINRWHYLGELYCYNAKRTTYFCHRFNPTKTLFLHWIFGMSDLISTRVPLKWMRMKCMEVDGWVLSIYKWFINVDAIFCFPLCFRLCVKIGYWMAQIMATFQMVCSNFASIFIWTRILNGSHNVHSQYSLLLLFI